MKARIWYLLSGGLLIGAVAGYLYWNYVGCLSGTCSITSSPVNSTIYGGLMGLLTANLFTNSKRDVSKNK
jgi:phage shock protein E